MESPLLVGLVAVLGLALACAVAALVRLRTARRADAVERERLRGEVETARRDAQRLASRLEELERRHDAYLITGVGDEQARRTGPPVPDQLVLSAAFGEPLVRTLAFGHGVRRALSPEVRHRIAYEVRRETRRSRKQRRREMRQAWREARAEGRFDAPGGARHVGSGR